MIDPHGQKRNRAESSDKHDQDDHQLASVAQIRRDSGGKSHGTKRGDHLKQNLHKTVLRIHDAKQETSTHTTDMDKSVMMEALATVPLEIALRNAPTCLLLNMALASWIRTKNVVVLIPPPVDPGDAPINISTQSTNSPALVKLPMGYVENPAVLADTLWKKAPSQVTSSVAFRRSVPTTRSTTVVVITILECSISFLNLLLLIMSRITRNPRPPKMIRIQVIIFRSTLSLYGIRF